MVHMMSPQAGALARPTQAAAWQQPAGAQSASVLQASEEKTRLPLAAGGGGAASGDDVGEAVGRGGVV
jgi:hypothetical protein